MSTQIIGGTASKDPVEGGYNTRSGLDAWRRGLAFAAADLSGHGAGGVDVCLYGDSYLEGCAAGISFGGTDGTAVVNDYLFSSAAQQLKVMLQARYNPPNVVGGYGYIGAASAITSGKWLTGGANNNQILAFSNPAAWTSIGSFGTSVAARGSQSAALWNSTTQDNRVRFDFDGTDALAIQKRLGVTRVQWVCTDAANANNFFMDVNSAKAFVTPGAGSIGAGNFASTGANHWGVRSDFAAARTLTATVNNTCQMGASSSGQVNCYFDGLIAYNGDFDRGVRLHQIGHYGQTASGASTGNSQMTASIDSFCTGTTTTGATNAKLYVMDFITNDVGNSASPIYTVPQFTANYQTLITRIQAQPSAPSILLVIPPGTGGTNYVANAAPYVSAVYGLAAANNCALIDMWSVLSGGAYGNIYTSGAWFNMGATVADGTHPSNNGVKWIANALYNCITS